MTGFAYHYGDSILNFTVWAYYLRPILHTVCCVPPQALLPPLKHPTDCSSKAKLKPP